MPCFSDVPAKLLEDSDHQTVCNPGRRSCNPTELLPHERRHAYLPRLHSAVVFRSKLQLAGGRLHWSATVAGCRTESNNGNCRLSVYVVRSALKCGLAVTSACGPLFCSASLQMTWQITGKAFGRLHCVQVMSIAQVIKGYIAASYLCH